MTSRLSGTAAEAALLLLLLLECRPAPLTPLEAIRERGPPAPWSVLDVRDAITRLEEFGLIRQGDLLFASRAAVRCAAEVVSQACTAMVEVGAGSDEVGASA
ncbi:hypothetical protein AB0L40_00635 [Patulibacter sp. NPDC049589]|uniref:hypothetical protein n=1 Tax=Patulibacter sp. NPDC049589 TaxID=3154731 RepID=UPI0034325A2E